MGGSRRVSVCGRDFFFHATPTQCIPKADPGVWSGLRRMDLDPLLEEEEADMYLADAGGFLLVEICQVR